MDIELCSFSTYGLLEIDKSIRIELCSNYYEGGLSPGYTSFLYIRQRLDNKLFVMVRPRGGDFQYSNGEFELMKKEISWFKENGADGIVVGLLSTDGTVDIQRTLDLVHLAAPLPVTFHRAFDMSVDLNQALEDVIKTGCTRVLTSGGAFNVELGFDKLVELQQQAKGRIEIMPGGGVSRNNVQRFMDAGFKNIHLSAKKMVQSKMKFQANLSMTANSNISSFDYIGVDLKKLNQFVTYVRENEIL